MRHALAAIGLAIGVVALFIAVRGMMGSPPEVPVAAPPTPLEEKVAIAEQPAIPVAKAAVEAPPPAEPAPKPKVSTWQDTPEKYIRRVEFKAENTTSLDTKRELYLEIFALQKQEHDHEAADAALLRAAQIAEQRPAGEIDARTQRPSQYTGKEGGAYTILREAQLEIVKKDFANARRHLGMVIAMYSRKSPIAARQAQGHLDFLNEAEGKAKPAPKAVPEQKPAEAADVPAPKTAASRSCGDQEGCRQTQLVKATAVANTVIYTGAKANTSYTITAKGTWAQDPDASLNTGPEGLASFGNIGDGPFAGMFFGSFAVKAPGNSQWVKIGASGTITPTQDGDILGSFADGIGAFDNNNGYMFVTTVEDGCDEEATDPGQAPTAALAVNPEISDINDFFAFNGSESVDNDEFGAEICLYTLRISNLTRPLDKDIVFESDFSPNFITTFARGGEYLATLQVVDNEGDTATASKRCDVVEVQFDPPSISMAIGQQATTHAVIIPSSGFDQGVFYAANAPILQPLFQDATAPAEDLTLTGTAIGSTQVVAVYEPRNIEIGFLNVTVTSSQTLPPTAVATTSTPIICVGEEISLDGSASFDNDNIGTSPVIRKYTWTYQNLTAPANAPAPVTTPLSETTQLFTEPGDYLIKLSVEDNDGEVSSAGDSSSDFMVTVIGITVSEDQVTTLPGEQEQISIAVSPNSSISLINISSDDSSIATVEPSTVTHNPQVLTIEGQSTGNTTLSISISGEDAEHICKSIPVIVIPLATALLTPTAANHFPFGDRSESTFDDAQQYGPLDEFGKDSLVVIWELLFVNDKSPNGGINISATIRLPNAQADTAIIGKTRIVLGGSIPQPPNSSSKIEFLSNQGKLQEGSNIIRWNGRLPNNAVPAQGSVFKLTVEPFRIVSGKDIPNTATDSVISVIIHDKLTILPGIGVLQNDGTYRVPVNQPVPLSASISESEGGGIDPTKVKSKTKEGKDVEGPKAQFLIFKDDNSDTIPDPDFEPVSIPVAVRPENAEFGTEMVGTWDSRTGDHHQAPAGRYIVLARCALRVHPETAAVQKTPLVLVLTNDSNWRIEVVGDDLVDDGEVPKTQYSVKRLGPIVGGTTFNWRFEFPGEHYQVHPDFEPKIAFEKQRDKKTKISNPIYWYADKNPVTDKCGAARRAIFDILCDVKEPGKPVETVRAILGVQVTSPLAKTIQPISASRETIRLFALGALEAIEFGPDGETPTKYKYKEYTSAGFIRSEPQKRVFIPPNSQFYHKMDEHETVHVNQFKGSAAPNLAAWWSADRAREFVNKRLSGKEYQASDNLRDQVTDDIVDEFGVYVALEGLDFENRIQGNQVLNAIIEAPAYKVSDELDPKVLAQGECVLGQFSNTQANAENTQKVQPLSIDDLIKTEP